MSRRLGVVLFGVVVLLGAFVGAGTGSAVTDAEPGLLQPQTERTDFENVVFRIDVYENGTARWTVQYITPLENESEVENFETFAERFNTEELQLYRNFQDRAEQIVVAGRNVTDRPMEARAFDREAAVVDRDASFGQTRGVLEMSFSWTNFARSADSRLVVGDIFEGGLFLGANQQLVFRHGPSLAFVDVDPQPDSLSAPGNLSGSSSVTWFGQVDFADQRPFLELVPRSDLGTVATDAPGGGDGSEATPGAADGLGGLPFVVGGLVVVLALVGGAAWYTGQIGRGPGETQSAGTSSPGGTGEASAPAPGRSQQTAPAGVPEEELLTDEDRVMQLLDENGGRMKQVRIVEETDWSKSKVSMLLSDMEDEGQISKLRLGRENIISLAGQEPDAAGSPFEDEG